MTAHSTSGSTTRTKTALVGWAVALPSVLADDGDLSDVEPNPVESLPLEIGWCDPSRVFLHLAEDGGVVRWPSGWATLTALVPGPRWLSQRLAAAYANDHDRLRELEIDWSWWDAELADADYR